MKKGIRYIGLALILTSSACTVQEVVLNETNVTKLEMGTPPNPMAVDYALPRTVIDVKVIAEKKITKPGPFADYAERYLGVTNVPTRELTEWSILEVRLNSHGEKDPSQVFRIETEGISKAGYIALNDNGVICGVNVSKSAQDQMAVEGAISLQNREAFLPDYPDLTLRKNTEPMLDTVFRVVRTDTSFMRLPMLRTQVSQKNLMNQAEEAANIIMELREKRFKLLNGDLMDASGIPLPDGKAMQVMIQELAQMEYDYVSLFVGRTLTEVKPFHFSYLPNSERLSETEDLFTFSKFRGVLPAGNSNGDPAKISLLRKVDPGNLYTNNDYAAPDDKTELKKGLAYRIPGTATVSITLNSEEIVSDEFSVAQYGVVQYLPSGLFKDDRTVVEYHPATGLVKRIFIPLATK